MSNLLKFTVVVCFSMINVAFPQLNTSFEFVIPWDSSENVNSIGKDGVPLLNGEFLILTYNSIDGPLRSGNGIMTLSSIGTRVCKKHFETNWLTTGAGVPEFRDPAQEIFSEWGIEIPYTIYTGMNFCDDDSILAGNVIRPGVFGVTSDCSEEFNHIYIGKRLCSDDALVGYGKTKDGYTYFLLYDEINLDFRIEKWGPNFSFLGEKLVSLPQSFYRSNKRNISVFDEESESFVFLVHEFTSSWDKILKINLDGENLWLNPDSLPASSFTHIYPYKSGYLILKNYSSIDQSDLYVLSNEGEIISSKSFSSAEIKSIAICETDVVAAVFYEPEKEKTVKIVLLNNDWKSISEQHYGFKGVIPTKIRSIENNSFLVVGEKRDSLPNDIFKTNPYVLKAHFDLPEPTCTDLTTYPNPVRDLLTLETPLNLLPGERYTARLYDITGRVIQRYPELQDPARLDMSQISNGIYILEVGETGENPCLRKKIIVDHSQ